jgi:hypothetical protein
MLEMPAFFNIIQHLSGDYFFHNINEEEWGERLDDPSGQKQTLSKTRCQNEMLLLSSPEWHLGLREGK